MNERTRAPLEKQIASMSLRRAEDISPDLVPYAKGRELAIYEADTNRLNELLEEIRKKRLAVHKLRQSRYAIRQRLYDRRARDKDAKK